MTREEARTLKPFDRVIYIGSINPPQEYGIVKEVTDNGVRVVFSLTSSTAPLCRFENLEFYE